MSGQGEPGGEGSGFPGGTIRPRLILIEGETWGQCPCAERLFLSLESCAWLDGDDVWRVRPAAAGAPRLRTGDLDMACLLRAYLQAGFDYVILSSLALTSPAVKRRVLDRLQGVPYDLVEITLLCDENELCARAKQRAGQGQPDLIVLEATRERTGTVRIDTAGKTPEQIADEMLAAL
jgi:hypothetical protein